MCSKLGQVHGKVEAKCEMCSGGKTEAFCHQCAMFTGKQASEKGMVKRVVFEFVSPFSGLNHVLYLDDYFTSGPLVEELYKEQIDVASTIQQRAVCD